jgi:hypothetical protein
MVENDKLWIIILGAAVGAVPDKGYPRLRRRNDRILRA